MDEDEEAEEEVEVPEETGCGAPRATQPDFGIQHERQQAYVEMANAHPTGGTGARSECQRGLAKTADARLDDDDARACSDCSDCVSASGMDPSARGRTPRALQTGATLPCTQTTKTTYHLPASHRQPETG